MPISRGNGRSSPAYTCTVTTNSRRPTMAEIGGMYSIRAVAMTTAKRVALIQWTTRSARSKRRRGGPVSFDLATAWSGRGCVASTIAVPHPPVDVVAQLFPVPGDHLGHHRDPGEPFARFVAVHGRHIQPHRTAVVSGHG